MEPNVTSKRLLLLTIKKFLPISDKQALPADFLFGLLFYTEEGCDPPKLHS
jgi:hypothetical protein